MHSQLHGDWSRAANLEISTRLKFKDFAEAFGAATRVAMLSEQEGHHPDMKIGWGYLEIKLTTHAAKGLTDNDFIMAAKIEKALTPQSGNG